MQTFQTAAVVGLIDNMSGPLKQLSKQAQALAKEFTSIAKMGSGGGDPLESHTAGLNRATAAAQKHLAVMKEIRGYTLKAAAVAAPLGVPLAMKMRSEMPELKDIQDGLSRLRDNASVPADVVKNIRNDARIDGSKIAGGEKGYIAEADTAARANIPNPLISSTAKVGQQMGDFMREKPGEGVEKLINIAEFFGYFKNSKGERTSPKELYEQNIAGGMSEEAAKADIIERQKAAAGKYRKVSNMMPGSEKDLLSALEMANPAAESTKVPMDQVVGVLSMLATGGIKGSHAGTLTRGMLMRMANPSQVAMASARAAGVDMRDYMSMDERALNPDGFVGGLKQFYSPILKDKPLSGKIQKQIADFKSDPNAHTSEDWNKLSEKITNQIVTAGGKNKKGADVYNSELVSKRVNKELNLTNNGVDLMRLIKDLKAKGQLTPGLMKTLVGTEGSTAMGQIGMQDIDAGLKAGKEATEGSQSELAKSWDDFNAQRADSVYGVWEGIGNRVSGMFDKVFESIEQKLKPAGDAINKTLDTGLKSSEGTAAAIGVGGAGLAGLSGAGAGAVAINAGWLGTGAIATAGTAAAAGLAVASGTLVAGAAAYLAYKAQEKAFLEPRNTPWVPYKYDMSGKPHVFKPTFYPEARQEKLPFKALPQWEAPKEWPTSAEAIHNVTKDGALSAGSPPARAVEVTGTVTGEATIAVSVTVNPSPLLTSIVEQAKNAGSMQVRGKLGTGLSGDGNATKESQPARTNPSGGSH